jgi:hypothetical protein
MVKISKTRRKKEGHNKGGTEGKNHETLFFWLTDEAREGVEEMQGRRRGTLV